MWGYVLNATGTEQAAGNLKSNHVSSAHLNVFFAFSLSQHGTECNKKNIAEFVINIPVVAARVFERVEMVANRGYCSAKESSWLLKISNASTIPIVDSETNSPALYLPIMRSPWSPPLNAAQRPSERPPGEPLQAVSRSPSRLQPSRLLKAVSRIRVVPARLFLSLGYFRMRTNIDMALPTQAGCLAMRASR